MPHHRLFTDKSPHNRYPMGMELMVLAWNHDHPDDPINSRQAMQAAVKRAEFSLAIALSNDPYMRDIMQKTVEAEDIDDHQRQLLRIVGLSEGMPESYAHFKRGEF